MHNAKAEIEAKLVQLYNCIVYHRIVQRTINSYFDIHHVVYIGFLLFDSLIGDVDEGEASFDSMVYYKRRGLELETLEE